MVTAMGTVMAMGNQIAKLGQIAKSATRLSMIVKNLRWMMDQ